MQHNLAADAPIKCTTQTTDVDQQADNLSNWQQEYDQVSNGSFYGCIEEIAYDDLQVFKEYTHRALRQQCQVWPNSLWLGIPVQTSNSKINGLTIDSNQLMCRPSACDFELVTPEQFNIYGMVVNQDTLRHIAQCQGISLTGLCQHESPRITTSAAHLEQARNGIAQLIKNNSAVNTHIQHEMLFNLILTLLQSPQPKQKVSPSYQHRKAVVERVKDYINAHPHDVITMTQLCELSHVSRRTLQYSFESILGINPLRFLRITRLNQVRRELSDPQLHKPVSVIAANWGFGHPGQFAKDYKQLFGENPSATAKRRDR
ncbi:helix-turn-helix domain-containing protein [Pseudoalteromonas sp. ASV78]|uniref:helix-turn-helix domain-containing protein n=1 Tax=Pseudoalteromonas sp. ASV78 TaxID=3397851 RepID=UPI0039FCDAAF